MTSILAVAVRLPAFFFGTLLFHCKNSERLRSNLE
jgi:hypothetical protein